MLSLLLPFLTLIKKASATISEQLFDSASFNEFLRSRGWDSNILSSEMSIVHSVISIEASIESIVEKITAIENVNEPIIEAIGDIIPEIESLLDDIRALKNVAGSGFSIYPLNQQEFWNEFGELLFDDVMINFIERNSKPVFSLLHLTGIIHYEWVIPSNTARFPYQAKKFEWGKLGQLFTNPTGLIKERYNWASGQPMAYETLYATLERILAAFSIPSKRALIQKEHYDEYFPGFLNNNIPIYSLEIPLLENLNTETNNYKRISIKILPAPSPANNNLSGVILVPEITGVANFLFPLSPEFLFKGSGYFSSDNFLGFKITPDGASLHTNVLSPSTAIGAKIALVAAPAYPWILIGNESSSRLMCAGFEMSAEIRGAITDPEFIFRIGTGEMVNKPNFMFIYDPGSNDSFITKILGDKPINFTFGIGLSWSSKHGIGFEGAGGFSFEIPLHKNKKSEESSFPFKLNTIRISANASTSGQSSISLGFDFDFDLKAIKASVRDIGIKVAFKKKEASESRGIFNGLGVNFGFKFPTGVALAIDAGPVKGGGFLNYDESTWTYTGGLELNFSKISFSAIGIVSTKLPGGEKGYSLLIIITAEFGPIPLGMGFTLNGLGGILGLHRTMNPDVLRTGIRDNTLDHILFPKDIVKNANTIISNINQAFPIKKDQFLVGPMAKIGWGTPTLLTIELGIIIELPEPVRLAILGVVKALLPSKENPIVRIQINFLGIIDFTNKYLSFDASLYDSQILTFGLFGDMALRLYWGDKPAFLLSVGGFHPKFTPPPLNLPELRRLTLVLANQDNLKISVETYFAVTSNSVQFGAKVAAMAKAWKIQAIGALWFDILFQFKPFYFIADMGVMFAIKMGSKTILSLFVQLTLEGPNPWRAQGKGSFKVLFVKVSVSFDKTFGQARVDAIEAVDVNPKLIAALTSDDNWEALLPERSHQMVAFREETTTTLSVDPGGSLRISQRLLPLQTELQKFGSSAIRDSKRFDITGVTANGSPMAYLKVQDYFARNEFYYMKDEEKLSRPSYELFDSGVIAGSDSIASAYAVHKVCDFEEITIDLGYRRPEPRFKLATHMFGLQRFGNYVSRSPLSGFDGITTSKGPDRVRVSLDDDQFVLADRNNLSTVAGLS